MNETLLNKIVLILEICSPIFTGLTILYFRLSSRIEKAESKSENRFDSLRKEMREEIQKIEHKFEYIEQKFDQNFGRIDQKLDRVFEILVVRNQSTRDYNFRKTKK